MSTLPQGWQLSLRMAALPKDGSSVSRWQLLFEIEALLNMTALPQMLAPCQDSNSASTPTPNWQLYLKMAAPCPGIAFKFRENNEEKTLRKNSISLKKYNSPEVHRELLHRL